MNIFLSRFEELRDSQIVIKHTVDVPIGAGFGTSGAAALGLALALNKTFDLGLSSIEAAQLAHVAEIECKTGLGTVIAEYFGGVEIRVKPGAPGIGEIRNIPVPKDVVVACLAFGSLSTQKFLTNPQTRRKTREIGGDLVNALMKDESVTNFMALSRQFAEHLGLITRRIRMTLDATDEASLICSMPMFGESVFTLIERKNLKSILEVFEKCKSKGRIIVSGVDQLGARLL
jgi:pantoate kinase